MPLGPGDVITDTEQRQLIAHRRPAEPARPQTHLHDLWIRQRAQIPTTGLSHDADHRVVADIQTALLDQEPIHDCVEVGVVHRVVDVAVDVVIRPPRLDIEEVPVVAAHTRSFSVSAAGRAYHALTAVT